MEIVFVRHGESIGNVAKEKGTSYDASNICLTSKGVEQATQTGKYLEIFGNFDVVITSPMLRCAETTEIIVRGLGYRGDIIIDDRLIEWGNDFDPLEGLSKEQKDKIIPDKLKQLDKKMFLELNPFKKIELAKQFRISRDKLLPCSPTLYESWDNYNDFLSELSTKPYKRVLIVSHSVTMATIMQIICSIDKNINWIQIGTPGQKRWLENCSIMCVGYNRSTNQYTLVSAPSDSHLSFSV
jgi:broad specificity phosphatase PhoE